jgi:ribA/ribD-fused uncharacterized protein
MVAFRTYRSEEVADFLRVRERFGAFSNMAPGYPMTIAGVPVASSEALYQALRFPHLPDLQREILEQPVPILSKRHAYTRIAETRPDWDRVKVNVMRYALRAKFGSTQGDLLDLLRGTGERPIVEISNRDDFWGARPVDGTLVGRNVLGCLLMELREEMAAHPDGASFRIAPRFPGARLLGADLGPEELVPVSPRPDSGEGDSGCLFRTSDAT